LPETIAVLPVNGDGKPEDLKELRVTFFNHIGSKNYRDMELGDVDSKIFLEEQKTGKNWRDFTTKRLGEILKVDGLIYVDVVGVDKIYAGIYGSLTVRLNIKLVDALTGNLIWEKEDKVVRQSGGIPLSPWAAISTAISSAMVLRDSVKIELFDQLCRGIAKDMPEPPSLLKVRPPTIFSVVTNALDSPFKGQEEILISLKGDEGLDAYFNIGDIKKGIELQEIKPGHYLGKYIISDGNNWENQLVEVFLADTGKKVDVHYQVPYLVTVDTNPPGTPAAFSTSMVEKGVKLSWEKPGDEDLQEFVLSKAVLGKSEYTELSRTSLPEFVDEKTDFGQKIFYRVAAVDKAGNISKPAELNRMMVKPGPTDITGEIKEDTVFYSTGSPYIVSDELKVPKGLTLTIEAGTVIRFLDGASLVVEGKIKSEGTKESGVSFKGNGYNIILNDTGDEGGVFSYTFFRNGGIFDVVNSEAQFKDCRFESFEIAIKSTFGSDVQVFDSQFEYNEVAVMAESGALKVFGSAFLHNSEAMSLLADVKIQVKNITLNDNVTNITTQKDMYIDKVTIENIESFEAIRSFRGPIKISSVVPFGKSLDALKNDSGNDLIEKITESLLENSLEDTARYFEILKELFAAKYEKLKAIEAYVIFNLGQQTDAKRVLDESDAQYADALANSMGLGEVATGAKVNFVKVRIPVVGSGEGIGKIAGLKASKQAVKDYVGNVTGKLKRKKRFIVKDKILSKSNKYTKNAYTVFSNVKGSKFEGLYIVFLDENEILADLQDLRIIGNKKRELRIGLAACGSEDIVRPILARELNTMLFPISELPSKGCSFGEYREEISANSVDMLVLVKEGYSTSGSRVSKNLKMINADVAVHIYDTKSERLLHSDQKGVVVYHMNESMGSKAAMKNAYDAVGKGVLDKLVEIERNRAPATEPAPLPKPETAPPVNKKEALQEAKPVKNAEVKKKTPASLPLTPSVPVAAPKVEATKPKPKKAEKPAPKPEPVKTPEPAPQPVAVAPEPEKELKLSVAGVELVFANMPDEFIEKPFMTLAIENETAENIKKAELVLDVPGYFPYEVGTLLESIPAKDRVRLQLFAEFSGDVMKLNKTKKVDSVITITYGDKVAKITYPVTIFESHTLRWNDGGKIALFIDEEAETVTSIAAGITKVVDGLGVDAKLRKFYKALIAFEYLSNSGFKFEANSKRPFSEVYGSMTKVDTVNFPEETLEKRRGDADDLFALYASILKAMKINSGFAVVDGKIVAMFDTALPEELLGSLKLAKEDVVVFNENIWIPVDMQKISDGANGAWQSAKGSKDIFEDSSKVVVVSEASKKYKPVKLFRGKVKVAEVAEFTDKYSELIRK
jgi:hypothetical protein